MEYIWHVGDITLDMGQKYHTRTMWQTVPGGNGMVPQLCCVENFHALITQHTDDLGVLLITSHAGSSGFIAEAYAPSCLEWANTRREMLVDDDGNGPNTGWDPGDGHGPLLPSEIIFRWDMDPSRPRTWVGLSVQGEFISRRGHLNQALVFVGGCYTAGFTDAFVAGNARCAAGFTREVGVPYEMTNFIETFFKRMDGKEPFSRRSVVDAMNGMPMAHAGDPMVCLAPTVMGIDAYCPLHPGDKVYVHFDASCDTSSVPDIVCGQANIGQERWLNVYDLEGTCTSEQTDITKQCFHISWTQVKSFWNTAHLDGSMNPPPEGDPCDPDTERHYGEGPAHDDFVHARW